MKLFCPLKDYNQCKCNSDKNCVSFRQVVNTSEFTYIIVPKSASTAIQRFLRVSRFQPHSEHWMNWGDLQKQKNQKYVFSVVRDPYARLVSGWNGWVYNRSKGPVVNNKNIFFRMEFKPFVKELYQMERQDLNEHFQLQTEFLFHDKKPICNFIGKLESIDRDWDSICSDIEIHKYYPENTPESEFKLYKAASGHWKNLASDYMDFYDRETLDIVNEIYYDDFKLLGYETK